MKYFNKIFTPRFNMLPALLFLGIIAPLTTNAAPGNTCAASFTHFGAILDFATCILSRSVVPLLITIALIMFFLGVLRFMTNADDATKRQEGKQFMLWGIVALFTMLSVWGILAVLASTFQIGIGGTIAVPTFGP